MRKEKTYVSRVGLSKRARLPVFVILLALSATIVLPLFWVISTSLRSRIDFTKNQFGLPLNPTWENFQSLIVGLDVGSALIRTLIIVAIALPIQILLASLAAYGMAKYLIPGYKVINATLVSVMLIPVQVLLIPIYIMLAKLSLIGHYPGLVLVYVVMGLPFATFFLTLSFRDIPNEILESARLDGAGFLKTYTQMIIPMGISNLAALTILQFIGMWNEFLWAKLILQSNNMMLLTPTLALIGGRNQHQQETLLAAGLVITGSLPILVLIFFSKYIMGGLTVGMERRR